jgi:hypothetical protein
VKGRAGDAQQVSLSPQQAVPFHRTGPLAEIAPNPRCGGAARFGFATWESIGSITRQSVSIRIPATFDQRTDLPEQYLAIGWVRERLYVLIFEVREDQEATITTS